MQLTERRGFERSMRELVQKGIYRVPEGSFEIPLDGIMPGSGWYTPDSDGDVYWRWTGPGRYFTIEMPLRQDVSYRLTMVFGGLRPPAPEDLAAEINDVPIAFEPLQEGHRYRRELMIPRALLAQEFGLLPYSFRYERDNATRAAGIRSLGVAVRRIQFECLPPSLICRVAER